MERNGFHRLLKQYARKRFQCSQALKSQETMGFPSLGKTSVWKRRKLCVDVSQLLMFIIITIALKRRDLRTVNRVRENRLHDLSSIARGEYIGANFKLVFIVITIAEGSLQCHSRQGLGNMAWSEFSRQRRIIHCFLCETRIKGF